MDKLLVLINGLPGSGKSTLGRALAPKLHAQFLSKDTVKVSLAMAQRPRRSGSPTHSSSTPPARSTAHCWLTGSDSWQLRSAGCRPPCPRRPDRESARGSAAPTTERRCLRRNKYGRIRESLPNLGADRLRSPEGLDDDRYRGADAVERRPAEHPGVLSGAGLHRHL
ncbi:AAA family ATPase [Nocardia asteroides]|uniref:AAA family ATPase n=1 Tax=Nocardia asteroides TaxID=1824 RepID=UPI0036486F75